MLKEKNIYFVPIGGCGEIGMNTSFYGHGKDWIVIDYGISFAHEPEGILIPNIHRILQFLKKEKATIHGLIVTHPHEDHHGGIPHLANVLDCPIYATPFAHHLIQLKLKEAKVRANLKEISLNGHFSVGPFKAEYIALTHSTLESNGVFLDLKGFKVFHTGDWKLDPHPQLGSLTNIQRLQEIGVEGVDVMVCDSTNVFEPGHSGSEEDVRKSLMECVQESPVENKIVITCFASNLDRLAICREAALSVGRKPVIAGKSLLRFVEAARKCGYFTDEHEFIPVSESTSLSDHEKLIITTGSQAEPKAGLSRMAMKQHPQVRLSSGDTVIFSSRIIPGNEKAIHVLQNQLVRLGVRLITHKHYDNLHVSGHPYQEELCQMYQWVRPKIAIPVHGEDRHIDAHATLAENNGVPTVLRPHNGQMYTLNPTVELLQVFPEEKLFLDGNRFVPSNGLVIQQRRELLNSGMIHGVFVISRQMKTIISREFSFYGLCENSQEEKALSQALADASRNVLFSDISSQGSRKKSVGESAIHGPNVSKIVQQLEEALQKALWQRFKKKSVVKAQIVWA